MPLYEYLCDTCGEKFEVMQKFADQPLSTHDKCGGKVARLISAPALQFKGTGWYITDYAKGGSSSGNSGKDEAGKSKNAENSKSESSKSDGSKTESSKTNSDKSAASTPAASSSSSEKK